MRIRQWINRRIYKLASWWQWRRPIVVRRYVLIERDTAEAELKAMAEDCKARLHLAYSQKAKYDRELAEHNACDRRFCDLERKYAKLRRAIEDVRAITVGAS